MSLKSFYRLLRSTTYFVIFFFCWSSLELFRIPTALAAQKQQGKGATTSQAPAGGKARGKAVDSRLTTRDGHATAGERFEKTVNEIRENLGKAEEKSQKGEEPTDELAAIKAKRASLEEIDSAMKSEFAAAETRLKSAKLQKTTLDRHYAFVKRYQDNLKELAANLDALAKAGKKSDVDVAVRTAKEHLDRIKAPSRHRKLDARNLPFSSRKAAKARQPRTKEQFEKDFSPQKARRAAYLNEKQYGRKKAQEAQGFEAVFHYPKSAIEHKPILVASNGPLTGLLSTDSKTEIPALPGLGQWIPPRIGTYNQIFRFDNNLPPGYSPALYRHVYHFHIGPNDEPHYVIGSD